MFIQTETDGAGGDDVGGTALDGEIGRAAQRQQRHKDRRQRKHKDLLFHEKMSSFAVYILIFFRRNGKWLKSAIPKHPKTAWMLGYGPRVSGEPWG